MIGLGKGLVHGVELEVGSVGCCQFGVRVVVWVAVKLYEDGFDT